MKKWIALMLAIAMLLCTITGCDGSGNSGNGDDPGSDEAEVKRIAVVCDPVGTNPFLTQIADKFEAVKTAGTYPMDYSIVECVDDAAWSEKIRASVEEGYDFILVVGQQGADPLSEIAAQFPDKAQYAIIDATCDSENVKSYIFNPQETAYLIGIIAASVSADAGKPNGPFGSVHTNPGQESFEWRWGYMEGARSVNPDLMMDDFLFSYIKSSDAAAAKELALQQAAQGCVFINAAVSDYGVFEAAIEKNFYTSGQDTDMTTPDNPNIITSQVKYTGAVAEMAIEEFFTSKIQPGVVSLGLADGVAGVVYITDDGSNPRNAVLTDDIIAAARAAADKIKSGELTLEVPLEEDYSF